MIFNTALLAVHGTFLFNIKDTQNFKKLLNKDVSTSSGPMILRKYIVFGHRATMSQYLSHVRNKHNFTKKNSLSLFPELAMDKSEIRFKANLVPFTIM